MATPYAALTDAEQIEALRPCALEAAAAFGLEVAALELLLHSYNTTFSLLTADGRRFALRLGTNSKSTVAHARAQQAWVAAIAAETEVRVPEPLRAADGEAWVLVQAPPLGREVLVTAASWLAGGDAGALTPESAAALGRAMAQLHVHAAGWVPPAGAALPVLTEPLFGDEDVLHRAPIEPAERAVLDETRRRGSEVLRRVSAAQPLRALHADLHGGNVKWHEGQVAVFDFDDAGMGVPALDLAIATFYLRGQDPALEVALRQGYASVTTVPAIDGADFETLIAARQLLLANAMLAMSTAELRSQGDAYARTAVDRLRRWLETGTFTRD